MTSTIRYHLSAPKRHTRFLELSAEFPVDGKNQLLLQLPAWRPGRYELGNFARNIQKWQAFDQDGNPLHHKKVGKELWMVECEGMDTVKVEYNFYADILNAGSTWIDAEQIYVNPVNCFLFDPTHPSSNFDIELDIPDHYQIATGMEISGKTLKAKGVQQLLDCPFFAAEGLWKRSYKVGNCEFHIWVKGKHRLDENRVLNEFKSFTEAQMKSFGDIPCSEYHFLFQFPDHPSRHGVEHENSTVITLGPAERLLTREGYDEFLGISCHELYHTWNVKNIRPVEMMPYDFTKENFSRLGYVAEGVTTYYGDLYLLRSGVWTVDKYLKELAQQIKRHLHNAGRFNLSVADSSYDTWIDGYERGVPHRKVSIYTEGCLTAFMTDVAIMQNTQNNKSLDDAMLTMYERFGKTGVGYSEKDYREVLEATAGGKLDSIFNNHIEGTEDYLPSLQSALEYLGIDLHLEAPKNLMGYSGMLFTLSAKGVQVHEVWPGSPADKAGLTRGDLLVSINNTPVDEHLERTILLAKGKLEIGFIRDRILLSTSLELEQAAYYPEVKLSIREHNEAFKAWSWSRI